MTDPIEAARAMIEPLIGYTPRPWEANINDQYGSIMVPLSGWDGDFKPADARLIAAAPDLRDMVATLADALEAERAKRQRAEAERDQALAWLAAAHREAIERCAALLIELGYVSESGETLANEVRGLRVDPDAQAALNKLLADVLETERAKVAAAFKAGVKRGVAHAAGHTCEDEGCPHYDTRHSHPGDLEAPADAQAALDKLLAEARLEGWRAGRVAAADEAELYGCSEGSDEYTKGVHEGYTDAVSQIVDGIRALPEPKETSHD